MQTVAEGRGQVRFWILGQLQVEDGHRSVQRRRAPEPDVMQDGGVVAFRWNV
jgi:hypothetical protein